MPSLVVIARGRGGNCSSHLSPILSHSSKYPPKNPPGASRPLCLYPSPSPVLGPAATAPLPPHSLVLGTEQGHPQDSAPSDVVATALI